MNAISRPTGAQRPMPPVTVPASPTAMRTMRLIASATVAAPPVVTLAAVVLAVMYGVSATAWWLFGVMFVLTGLGISIGFHRLFSHRAFLTSRPMRLLLLGLGSMAMEGSLLFWASSHRRHHQFSDMPGDPHSPHWKGETKLTYWGGFWNGHVGWMFPEEMTNAARFCPDLLRDSQLLKLQGYYLYWVALGLALPAAIAFAVTGTAYGALEGFMWGGAARMLLLHHADWAVGSICHMMGERRFATRDHSANNYWVAALSFGEGLQNNHHAFPNAARHALRWYEPDAAGWVIGLGEKLGVFWDVKHPTPAQIENKLLPH